jgi:hypothetical protein
VKDRLVTLGLAACALVLFWVLMFPKPPGPANAPHPLTTGSNPEGYLAMARWLAATHVPSLDLHKRFDHLGDRTVSPQSTGNLLILTMPFAVAMHREEFAALDAWVRRGNTLLILAALDDTPLWSAFTDNFVPDLQTLTAMLFSARQAPNPDRLSRIRQGVRSAMTPQDRDVELHPSGRIQLLAGVSRLATQSPLPADQWLAKPAAAAPLLELARRADSADPVLWMRTNGDGAVVVSAYASLFSNAMIGKDDNARLFSNIVAWSVKEAGRVIVDDAHQGAVDEYDATQFFADPRLHRTLMWLVTLWLAWVLATQPLRASEPNTGSLDESAMLRVTAGFFASVLRPVPSAQWLLDEFSDRLRRRHGLPHAAGPPWDWLAAQAGVASTALGELRRLYQLTQEGRRVNLMKLQRTISQISGQTS